jgi:hypothetical protein
MFLVQCLSNFDPYQNRVGIVMVTQDMADPPLVRGEKPKVHVVPPPILLHVHKIMGCIPCHCHCHSSEYLEGQRV